MLAALIVLCHYEDSDIQVAATVRSEFVGLSFVQLLEQLAIGP